MRKFRKNWKTAIRNKFRRFTIRPVTFLLLGAGYNVCGRYCGKKRRDFHMKHAGLALLFRMGLARIRQFYGIILLNPAGYVTA